MRLRSLCPSSLARHSHRHCCRRRQVYVVAHYRRSNPRHSKPRQHMAHLHITGKPAARYGYPLTGIHRTRTRGTANHIHCTTHATRGSTTTASHAVPLDTHTHTLHNHTAPCNTATPSFLLVAFHQHCHSTIRGLHRTKPRREHTASARTMRTQQAHNFTTAAASNKPRLPHAHATP